MPEELRRAVEARDGHFMGGIHAVEHAALALCPLFALCDRHDVAGISYARHPQLGKPAIFLYDGHPGGAGLAPGLFERVEPLLEATLELVADCECEEGCPSCVHSPKCGSGNRPIDKAAARQVLELLLAREALPVEAEPDGRPAARPAAGARAGTRDRGLAARTSSSSTSRRSARALEVGGWHNAHLMRVALAVVYEAREDRFVDLPRGGGRGAAAAPPRRGPGGRLQRAPLRLPGAARLHRPRPRAPRRPSTSSTRSTAASASASPSATSARRPSAARRAPTGSSRCAGGRRGASTRSRATAAPTSRCCATSSSTPRATSTCCSAPSWASGCASRCASTPRS